MRKAGWFQGGWKYWVRLFAVGVLGGVLFGYGLMITVFVEFMIRPAPSVVCCQTPADFNLEYENVTFTSNDGITLSGWYIPSRNRAVVILLHGFGDNRMGMLSRAVFLAQNGFGVLLYDLRAHGESGGRWRTSGWLDVNDVDAAVAFVQGHPDVDPNRIGIMGFSYGAQISLRATGRNPALKAVVADGPGLARSEDAPPANSSFEWLDPVVTWSIDRYIELRTWVRTPPGVKDLIPKISPRPVMLIATGRDPNELRISENYFNFAGAPKTLWEIPEAAHGGGLAARPEEYEQKVVDFFTQDLLANP